LYDIPLAIARVISRNIRLDAPKVNRLSAL